jgi:glutathione S-transferase
VDQDHRRALAGYPVDHAPAVQLDLPLLELRRIAELRRQNLDAAAPVAVVRVSVAARPTCRFAQRGTSARTLAKGHTGAAVLRLITIPISHYCEKARWALDRAGIAYREEPHVQGVHRIAVRRAGGGITAPVLVTDGRVLADSADILDWVDERIPAEQRLFPADASEREQVRSLCGRLDERLGPSARRLMYVHILAEDRERMLDFNNRGVPLWEDRVIRRAWPLAERFLAYALGIRPGVEVGDEADVWRELDHVADLLADGRPYLLGERFGAADLTFAALAAAVVAPDSYGVPLPQPETLSPATSSLMLRARGHPAGRFALRMFAEQRRAPVAA